MSKIKIVIVEAEGHSRDDILAMIAQINPISGSAVVVEWPPADVIDAEVVQSAPVAPPVKPQASPAPSVPPSEWVTLARAAEALNVSHHRFIHGISSGKIPTQKSKADNKKRVRIRDCRAYLEEIDGSSPKPSGSKKSAGKKGDRKPCEGFAGKPCPHAAIVVGARCRTCNAKKMAAGRKGLIAENASVVAPASPVSDTRPAAHELQARPWYWRKALPVLKKMLGGETCAPFTLVFAAGEGIFKAIPASVDASDRHVKGHGPWLHVANGVATVSPDCHVYSKGQAMILRDSPELEALLAKKGGA